MTTTRWFYVQDDKRLGPVDLEQLVHLVVTAALPPGTLVWHQGLTAWTEAERVPEITAQLPPPLPPGRPARPSPPQAYVTQTRSLFQAPAAAGSTRVEELRRRLEKDSSARSFAQLAEELRKEADFAEAIRVCREGVERYPNYPSLRLTLGRALLESGELGGARSELELVLQTAPDNIVAERLLGECLEALGDHAGARARYRAAQLLAPGDLQLAAKLRALDGREPRAAEPAEVAPPVRPESIKAAVPPTASPPDGPADQNPLAALDSAIAAAGHASLPESQESWSHELETPRPPVDDPPPIPLVPVEDSFEIERAGEVAASPKAPSAPVTSPPKYVSAQPAASARAAAPAARAGPAESPSPAARPRAAHARVASPPSPAQVPPPSPSTIPVTPTGLVAWPTGRLADHDFADLVREVHARRWSGLLTLNHMGVEKNVRVQEGRLVFASSSSPDDRLGELLLRRGRITLHQYVAAGRALVKGKRLGSILVEQGALDARELVKVVVEQTQEIIYSAFQWIEGVYHFTQGSDAAVEPITLKLSTADVILEGIRRVEAWSRIERAVGGMEARYVRADDYEQALGTMTLSLEKLSLLTGLEGVQDLGTICRHSALPHFEACRTVWAYRVIGVVRRLA